MATLTYLHFIYLLVIVLVIALMVMKHDVVIPCILGLFVLGFCWGGFSPITGAQAVFNGMMAAGQDLFDIMLVIGLMVAMLRSLEHIGADRMMIEPVTRAIKSPATAFWGIAAVMYICASFFWPTPATALVGTILIPIALKAGLRPMMACVALNIAGHGIALSGDLVLQGAPALAATASGADMEAVLFNGGLLSIISGVVTLAVAFILYRKEIMTPVPEDERVMTTQSEGKQVAPSKYARFFAILVPLVFFIIVLRILVGAEIEGVSKIFGGDATALLGGTAAVILLLVCLLHHERGFLEQVADYMRQGMLFSIKIFAVVIPIAAFFFTGNPESAPAILGEGAPGFLFDLGAALGEVIPMGKFTLALGIAVIGGITGLDGSGFSGIPLAAGLAAALGGPLGYNVAPLAALGQVAAIYVGGGCLSAWAFGAVAASGVAGVSSNDLVRKNFIPVLAGLVVATAVTVFLI